MSYCFYYTFFIHLVSNFIIDTFQSSNHAVGKKLIAKMLCCHSIFETVEIFNATFKITLWSSQFFYSKKSTNTHTILKPKYIFTKLFLLGL